MINVQTEIENLVARALVEIFAPVFNKNLELKRFGWRQYKSLFNNQSFYVCLNADDIIINSDEIDLSIEENEIFFEKSVEDIFNCFKEYNAIEDFIPVNIFGEAEIFVYYDKITIKPYIDPNKSLSEDFNKNSNIKTINYK